MNHTVTATLTLSILLASPALLARTPVATGTGGAVATISEQASQSAMTMLNKGGNAIDAAVAAAATLGVTDPFSCGIGGGGFMVIYLAKEKRVITIDHREMAPASFTPAVFQQNGKPVDFATAVASGAAVGVPGTVRGWHEALDRYGSMSFKQVLAPAIGVAENGFKVSATFNRLVAENENKFRLFSSTSALYLKDGKAIPVGSLLRNPDMAKAYRALATGGQRADVEHLYMEASRLAFADRNAYLADPEFVDAPVAGLLSKPFAAQRRALIDARRAASNVAAGDPYPFQDDQSVPLRPASTSLPREGAHTTHFTVSDRDGNIVSYTFTIESWGGSGIVVPGYGFLLNNEMTDFDFTGPRPNVPEAGKRPRSSIAPTIALKHGKPAFTIGSPGGATIITTVLQSIVNHVDLGMPMNDAIDAPRMSERNGGATSIEPGFADSAQAKALEQFGHKWDAETEEIGAANALVFNADGTVTAVSESRRHGGGAALVAHSRAGGKP